MGKADVYRQDLKALKDWEPYLLRECGLPGPRANLELVQVVADEGDPALFERLLSYDSQKAPANSAQEFLALCGVVGLGRLLAQGEAGIFEQLRIHAGDPRWRVREGVALALQRLGKADLGLLIEKMRPWAGGTRLEQRAAAAALAEPALLKNEAQAAEVLGVLDNITASMENAPDANTEEFKALQKGMSYCWSVAVAAAPAPGKRLMQKWLASKDVLIQKVMQENLKKNRLERMDAAWVAHWRKP